MAAQIRAVYIRVQVGVQARVLIRVQVRVLIRVQVGVRIIIEHKSIRVSQIQVAWKSGWAVISGLLSGCVKRCLLNYSGYPHK